MKKTISLILVAIMLVSLCGCFGGTEPEDVRGDIVSGNSSQNTQQEGTEPEFSLGKTANNTYTNNFLGLSCTLPAEWVFYTDEQILELNNIVADVVDEDVAESLKNADIIYDMYATNVIEGGSININLEKLSTVQMIGLDIRKTLEGQVDTIKSSYQNMGYTDIQIVYEKVQVDGKEFDALKITAKIQGVDFYVTVFSFKKSNYLANVTICSAETDEADTMLSWFTVK